MEFSGKMPGPLHEVGLPSGPEAVPEAPTDQRWVSEVLKETSQPPAKATKAGVNFFPFRTGEEVTEAIYGGG